jgi:hypothetical protein
MPNFARGRPENYWRRSFVRPFGQRLAMAFLSSSAAKITMGRLVGRNPREKNGPEQDRSEDSLNESRSSCPATLIPVLQDN